jgi:hypothetical protein
MWVFLGGKGWASCFLFSIPSVVATTFQGVSSKYLVVLQLNSGDRLVGQSLGSLVP